MSFQAKHAGTCVKCKGPIQPGQYIEGRRRSYAHYECPTKDETGCLMCGKECKHQRINSIENADMESFLRGLRPRVPSRLPLRRLELPPHGFLLRRVRGRSSSSIREGE